MVKVLLANLDLVLATVGIPVILMAVFTSIRKQAGNAVTAMPDVMVFLSSVNLYFAAWPEPWRKMVHPLVRESFAGLSLFLGVSAILLFLIVLPVERRIVRHQLQRVWPAANRNLMPLEILNQRFPFFGLIGSWILIATFAAVNTLAFVLR